MCGGGGGGGGVGNYFTERGVVFFSLVLNAEFFLKLISLKYFFGRRGAIE